MYKLFLPLACIAIASSCLFMACSKDTPNVSVHIDFEGNKLTTVNIYTSRADMYTNQNVLFSGQTDVGSVVRVPRPTFEAGKTYYVDAYTLSLSSNSLYGRADSFVFVEGTPEVFLPGSADANDPTFIRKVLLNNNQSIITEWKAIDALYTPSGLSVWATVISDNDKYKKLTFKKDFTGKLDFKDNTGTIKTQDFTYFPNRLNFDIPALGAGGNTVIVGNNGADTIHYHQQIQGADISFVFVKE